MSKKIKTCFIAIILIIIIFNLAGCSGFKKKEDSLEKKLNTEISYLDSELIMIANEMNNINYTRYKVKVENVENTSFKTQGASDGNDSQNQKSESENSSKTSDDKNSSQSQESGENSNGDDKKSSGENSSKTSKSEVFSMSAYNILDDNVNIDWNRLKSNAEKLYTSWTTISVDLKEAGISDDLLDDFGNNIDALAIAIKNENVNETIDGVIRLYDFLPKFVGEFGSDSEKNILECKSKLLYCYKYANNGDWNQFDVSIDELKMKFSNIVGDKENYKGKENNLESAFVIIREMKNSGGVEDKSIFLIKYKNLIQELNIIAQLGTRPCCAFCTVRDGLV